MPWFTYKCKKCSEIFRDYQTIANRNTPTTCQCGGKAYRDVKAELSPRAGRKWITDNGRWSIAMGVPQIQVEEFRKRFPDSIYNDKGHLWIEGRKDKLKKAKERQMIELDDNASKAWFR